MKINTILQSIRHIEQNLPLPHTKFVLMPGMKVWHKYISESHVAVITEPIEVSLFIYVDNRYHFIEYNLERVQYLGFIEQVQINERNKNSPFLNFSTRDRFYIELTTWQNANRKSKKITLVSSSIC